MRLDRALAHDLGRALRARPLQLYLAAQVLAAVVFVDRRGEQTFSTVLLIWLGLAIVAFVAWWAGRHRAARPMPDPVPAAGPRAAFALLAALGAMVWTASAGVGSVLLLGGIGGWAWAALRSGGLAGVAARLKRDPRPFVGLFVLVGLPNLLVQGPVYFVNVLLAVPSGVGQELALLLGLFAPLEVWSRRPMWAALAAAAVFAALHVATVMEPNQGDLMAACANVVLYQASVGLIAILAFSRHRAAVPLGVVHAMAIT